MTKRLWIGGRLRSPFLIEEGGGCRPDLLLWFDASRDHFLSGEIVPPDAPASALADELRKALAGNPRGLPGTIRVPDDVSASAIENVVPAGATLEVGPTPELDRIVDLMDQRVPGSPGMVELSYLSGGVTPAALDALFRAASALFRRVPWKLLDDTDVIEMNVPALGVQGACLVVIGAMKENFGVIIFDSYDDWDEFSSRDLDRPDAIRNLGVAFITLSLDPGTRLPDRMRREVFEHGWPVASPDAYPAVFAVEPDGRPRHTRERDLHLATAAAAGVTALVQRHARALRPRVRVPMSATVAAPEKGEIEVRLPHRAVFEWAREEPLTEREHAREMDLAKAQVKRFLDSKAAAALSAKDREEAPFLCEVLHEAKVNYLDGRYGGLAARHVHWFLLEHYPRKVSADAAYSRRVPAILDAYFAWLGEEGLVTPVTAARMRQRVARVREEFLSAATDPGRFGPAKSFVMAMEAAGVDFEDEAAVKKYMEEYNRSLGAGPARGSRGGQAGPDARGGSASSARPARSAVARWEPAPGEPHPPLDAPCPCGSGKRYKRCCRTR